MVKTEHAQASQATPPPKPRIRDADGEYDEREQLAIEAIVRELEANLSTSSQVMKSASHYSKALGAVAQDTSSVAFRATKTAVSKAKSFLGTFSKKTKS